MRRDLTSEQKVFSHLLELFVAVADVRQFHSFWPAAAKRRLPNCCRSA